ncbi:MAG: hypothetical protein ACLPX9_08200 [Rhodomicrobium sp.]
MKYSIISEADGPVKCHCNGELYWALEMENLSLTDGYPVQPVPWRQSLNARDAGCLKSQFMSSAKLPVKETVPPAARNSAPRLSLPNLMLASLLGEGQSPHPRRPAMWATLRSNRPNLVSWAYAGFKPNCISLQRALSLQRAGNYIYERVRPKLSTDGLDAEVQKENIKRS